MPHSIETNFQSKLLWIYIALISNYAECCTGTKPTTETGGKSKCCTPQQACCDGCNCSCCQDKKRDGPGECKCEAGNCKCCAGCKSK